MVRKVSPLSIFLIRNILVDSRMELLVMTVWRLYAIAMRGQKKVELRA